MASDEIDDSELGGNGSKGDSSPLWFWLFFIALLIVLLSAVQTWMEDQMNEFHASSPFFQVTNRDFSLFLWENPQLMRVNVSSKQAYLPGFQYLDKVTAYPDKAEDLVQAPPEVLFEYHTWHRLIGGQEAERVITVASFKEFLNQLEEWQPKWWPEAPADYRELVARLPEMKPEEHLEGNLPLKVRKAFSGWRNYFYEGEAINAMMPSYGQLREFLARNRHYNRNYWRNLTNDSDPNYLKTLSYDSPKDDEIVEPDQMTPFLRVELFNFLEASK